MRVPPKGIFTNNNPMMMNRSLYAPPVNLFQPNKLKQRSNHLDYDNLGGSGQQVNRGFGMNQSQPPNMMFPRSNTDPINSYAHRNAKVPEENEKLEARWDIASAEGPQILQGDVMFVEKVVSDDEIVVNHRRS